MAVTIIIPAHNLWPFTRACLQSLADCARGAAFRVVVADNGSTDETVGACEPLGRQLFPGRFEHLRLGANLGFARGCNAGAQNVETEFLLFLNNDITATPGWLETLLAAMNESERIHAASPLLLYPGSNRVQHAGVAYDPNLKAVHCFHQFPGSHPALGAIRGLQALSAAALLVRRHAFEAVGGFWHEYVNGAEDLDLSCVLRRSGGRLVLAWQSVLHHATSMTPGRHDHTAHNGRVLNRRVRGCFVPDLHRHAARAGYGLGLTPWLEPHMVMRPDAPEPEAGGDAKSLAAALVAEPLWRRGYGLLLDLLEQGGDKDLAQILGWAEAWAELCPSRRSLSRAAQTARAADDAAAALRWEQRLAKAEAMIAAPGVLTDVARSSLAWCRLEGIDDLTGLYEQWLDQAAGS